MILKKKIDQAINQYRMEMKILSQEKELLNQRESEIFTRFLDNCESAYEETFVGRFINPFRGIEWLEPEKESPQPTVEKAGESIAPNEPEEIDPLEVNKYSAD